MSKSSEKPNDKPTDLLGQVGSDSENRNKEEEQTRTSSTAESLRDAIRARGGKPKAFTRIQLKGVLYCLLRTQFLPQVAYQLTETLERPRAWWGRQDKLMVASYWGIIAPLLYAASLLVLATPPDGCSSPHRRDCAVAQAKSRH